jgi:uncharacterized protein (UPF0335 family)
MSEIIGRNTVSGEMLRGFVERIEVIEEKIADLKDDKGVIMAEAKAAGFLKKGISYVVKKRKMKPSERAEAEALEGMYMHAMGMAADNPLFRAVGLMGIDITAKESVIEAMKKFVPTNGSIVIEAGGAPVRLTRDAAGNVSMMEVIEKPVEITIPSKSGKAAAPKAPIPDVDADGAERLGREAFRQDEAVITNPFPFGDARRPRWDAGWRKESGTDGMGPDD